MTAAQTFNDHFSNCSASYAQYRPVYPDALFGFLASTCTRNELALDCATGSGQAAIGLSRFFEQVVATDASEQQITAAVRNARVTYRIAAAEATGLDSNSADLVTVAQALHWFDHARFFAEAERVLRRGGVLAAWCYGICRINDDCDAEISRLYEDVVGDFWPPERRFVDAAYANIEFPRQRIAVPALRMQAQWRVGQMLGYLRTWSACKLYTDQHGNDPVAAIEATLVKVWGNDACTVTWPVTLAACQF